jgi:hypothetical protein
MPPAKPGQTLTFNGAGDTTLGGNLTLTAGTLAFARTGGVVSVVTGSGFTVNSGATLNLSGAGVLSDGVDHAKVLNNSTSGFNVNSGTQTMGPLDGTGNTTVATGATLVAEHLRQNSLIVNGTARVRASGGNAGVSYLNSLSIGASGALDLNDNDLIVRYTSTSPFTTIRNFVFDGYSGSPDATKKGIVSSTGQSTGNTILALIDNALIGATDWPLGSGVTIATNSVIGKYTYFGDANFDGQVTADDYGVLDANLGSTPPEGSAWLAGDANLDGTVDANDYSVLDANLGSGVGNPLSPAGVSSVPEPAVTVPLAAAALLLRRRKNR